MKYFTGNLLLIILVIIVINTKIIAQVGINTTNIKPYVSFQIQSNTSGFLLPALNNSIINKITNNQSIRPPQGLFFFGSTDKKIKYFKPNNIFSNVPPVGWGAPLSLIESSTYQDDINFFEQTMGINKLTNDIISLKNEVITYDDTIPWLQVNLQGGPAPCFINPFGGNFYYKKDKFNNLYIIGKIDAPHGAQGLVFVLPEGYRPKVKQLVFSNTRHADDELARRQALIIEPNGNVSTTLGVMFNFEVYPLFKINLD